MRSRLSLTLDEAATIMAACLAEARSAGRAVSISITDDAGVLLAFQRMDGARAHTVDIALRKARASALVGAPTAMIEAASKDRPSTPESNPGAGGRPAMHDAECLGAVGVSGARPEEDDRIAMAGLAALKPA